MSIFRTHPKRRIIRRLTYAGDTYFGITKIIPHLVSMGAKQARHIVKDGYRSSNPNRWDDEFTGYSDGWFTVETQPFYEHWKLSYKLRSS